MGTFQKRTSGTKEFDFNKIIKCGSCGSGITPEEKFKNISDGTRRRYVYYHCSQGKRVACKEPYIREEELINQLLSLIDNINVDEICVQEKLSREIARYQKFAEGVLHISNNPTAPKVDIRSYAKYVLKEGTREEKREVLACLRTQLVLHNQTLSLKKDGSITCETKNS